MDFCLVSSARDIMSCFREGNRFLPSPPTNVRVHSIYSNNHVLIQWEDSEKNRDSTHWYWVYWKKVGNNEMDRDRVQTNYYELTSLEPDSTYEFVIKTVNYHGTSIPSEPLVINLAHLQKEYLTSENQLITNIFLALLFLLLLLAAIAFIYYATSKNRFLSKFRSTNHFRRHHNNNNNNIGVSFENHAYNLEDTIQMQENGHTTTLDTAIPATGNNNGFVANNNTASTNINEANFFNNNGTTSDPNNNINGQSQQPRVQIRLN